MPNEQFPECEQFKDVSHRYQNCRHERLTPEQCDRWRLVNGLQPIDPSVARVSGTFSFNKDRVNQAMQARPANERLAFPPAKPKPQVGDILGGLFARLGVASCIPGGGCQSTKGKMNAAGIQGCKDRRDEFIADIRERAKSVPASAWITAAAKAVTTGLMFHVNPLDPVPSLYDYAIRLAEEQVQ